ncbi:MAG: hypothetical protein E7476_11290 [Ruminococcaceae bacterium]|nr:hypothetical protein [Oscillospiraceae bacterium]
MVKTVCKFLAAVVYSPVQRQRAVISNGIRDIEQAGDVFSFVVQHQNGMVTRFDAAVHPIFPYCFGCGRRRVRPLGKNEHLPFEIVLV